MTPAEEYTHKRSHAVALIETHAPKRLQRSLIDLLRPAIALNATRCDDDEIPIGASKFGGAPDVAAGFEWPMWNDKPLGFLAQINLQEIAPFDVENVLPKTGLLSFFYEIDEPDYTDVSTPHSWSVQYFDGDLARVEFERETEFNSARMSFSAGWSSVATLNIPPELDKGEWRYNISVSPCPAVPRRLYQGHQMLGYGSPVIGDAAWYAEVRSREADSGTRLSTQASQQIGFAEAQQWILLFQLDSDDELNTMWGDVGTLFFMIRKSDLAQRNFEKTWMELQFT